MIGGKREMKSSTIAVVWLMMAVIATLISIFTGYETYHAGYTCLIISQIWASKGVE
jgi:hypothetical protein